KRPLLRRFERCVAEAGDVEVAAARALAMLVPHGLRIGEGEQSGLAGRRQTRLEAPPELGCDRPVVARLPGRWQRGAYAADASLAVGHRAVLLAPRRRRQQEV